MAAAAASCPTTTPLWGVVVRHGRVEGFSEVRQTPDLDATDATVVASDNTTESSDKGRTGHERIRGTLQRRKSD